MLDSDRRWAEESIQRSGSYMLRFCSVGSDEWVVLSTVNDSKEREGLGRNICHGHGPAQGAGRLVFRDWLMLALGLAWIRLR